MMHCHAIFPYVMYNRKKYLFFFLVRADFYHNSLLFLCRILVARIIRTHTCKKIYLNIFFLNRNIKITANTTVNAKKSIFAAIAKISATNTVNVMHSKCLSFKTDQWEEEEKLGRARIACFVSLNPIRASRSWNGKSNTCSCLAYSTYTLQI